jgi:hypothetical protein
VIVPPSAASNKTEQFAGKHYRTSTAIPGALKIAVKNYMSFEIAGWGLALPAAVKRAPENCFTWLSRAETGHRFDNVFIATPVAERHGIGDLKRLPQRFQIFVFQRWDSPIQINFKGFFQVVLCRVDISCLTKIAG